MTQPCRRGLFCAFLLLDCKTVNSFLQLFAFSFQAVNALGKQEVAFLSMSGDLLAKDLPGALWAELNLDVICKLVSNISTLPEQGALSKHRFWRKAIDSTLPSSATCPSTKCPDGMTWQQLAQQCSLPNHLYISKGLPDSLCSFLSFSSSFPSSASTKSFPGTLLTHSWRHIMP